VDSLILYHPFSPLDSKIHEYIDNNNGLEKAPPSKTRSHPEAPVKPAPCTKRLQEGHSLQDKDLCLVHLPQNGFEPLVVMRYMQDGANLPLLQWMGSLSIPWYIDQRMHKAVWFPGWIDAQGLVYFSLKRQHQSHKPYTNLLSLDVVQHADIKFFGFGLRIDFRLPYDVAEEALEVWRLLGDKEFASKPLTYESKTLNRSGKRGTLASNSPIPCACARLGCPCKQVVLFQANGLTTCAACDQHKCFDACVCKISLVYYLYRCGTCLRLLDHQIPQCSSYRCSGTYARTALCKQCHHFRLM
jgi:hypothetical protein